MTRQQSLNWSIAVVVGISLAVPGGAPSPAHASPRAALSRHHASETRQGSCATRNRATGTLRVSEGQLPITLNPLQNGNDALQNGLFDNLALYDHKLRLHPHLASVLPTMRNGGVRDGGRTIVWHLKHGLHWSDGQEITSYDIKFGWQIRRDPVNGPYTGIIGRIDTPDRYTAIWHLKQPRPLALCPCAMPPIWPVKWKDAWNGDPNKAALKLAKDPSFNFLGPRYPTNGPYQVTQYVNGKQIVLRPMKYYHTMSCGTRLSSIVVHGYSSAPSRLVAAAAGRVDLTWAWQPNYIPALQRYTAFRTAIVPDFSIDGFMPNLDRTYRGKPNPMANRNVRLALVLAIDKVKLTQAALGVDRSTAENLLAWTPWINLPAYGMLQPYTAGWINGQWDPLAGRYLSATGRGQALTDAKHLLARTPWRHGFTLDFVTAPPQDCQICATAVRLERAAAPAWSGLGIRVHTITVPLRVIVSGWNGGSPFAHGAFQLSFFGDIPEVDPSGQRNFLDSRHIERDKQHHGNGANENGAGVRDPRIDRAFDHADDPLHPAVRARNYALIQERVNRNAYMMPIFYGITAATIGKNVAGVELGGNGPAWDNGYFQNMYDWRLK